MAGGKAGKKRGSAASGITGRDPVQDTGWRRRRGGSALTSLLRLAAEPAVRLHHYRALRERALRGALCRQAVGGTQGCRRGEPQ